MAVIQMIIVILCSFLLASGLFVIWIYKIDFLFNKSKYNQDEKNKKNKVIALISLLYVILITIILYRRFF